MALGYQNFRFFLMGYQYPTAANTDTCLPAFSVRSRWHRANGYSYTRTNSISTLNTCLWFPKCCCVQLCQNEWLDHWIQSLQQLPVRRSCIKKSESSIDLDKQHLQNPLTLWLPSQVTSMCKTHDRTGNSCPLISFFKYCFSSLIWTFSTLFLGLIFLFSSRIHCNISRCCSGDTIGLGGGGGGGTHSWDGVFVGAIMVEGACWGVSCGFAIWASGSVPAAFSVVCGFGLLPNNTYAASSKW